MRLPTSIHPRFKLAFLVITAIGLTAALLVSSPGRMLPTSLANNIYVRIPDTVQHFTGYAVFAFALLWYRSVVMGRALFALLGVAIAHAMTTEWLQGFVPSRTPDLRDFAANLLGIAAGTLTAVLWIRRDQWRRPSMETLRRLRFTSILGKRPVPALAGAGVETAATDQTARHNPRLLMSGNAAATPALTATESIGMVRGPDLAAEHEGPIRRINYRLLGITFASFVILMAGMWKLRGYQVRRNAGSLYDQAHQAKADGDLTKARDFMGRYVSMASSNIQARAEFGQMLDADADSIKKKRRVFMIFEDVLREDPILHDIRRRQAELAIEIDRINDAEAHLRILRQSFPEDGHLDYIAGRCAERSKDDNSAIAAYRAAIEHDAGQLDAFNRLARLLHAHDHADETAAVLADMLVMNPKSAEARVIRGKFRQEFGSPAEATTDINTALEMDPKNVDVHLAAGKLAFDEAAAAQHADQLDRMTRIVTLARSRLETIIELRSGQSDAKPSTANKLTDQDVELVLQLAHIESYFGKAENASKWFMQVLEQDEDEPRALAAMADLMIQVGKFEQARGFANRLPRSPDADALRQFLEARMLIVERNWKQAHTTLETARRLMSDSPQLSERTDLVIAKVLEELGDTDSQGRIYRRILKDNVRSLPAQLGLASSYLRSGQLDDAVAEYRQMLHVPKVRLLLAQLLMIQYSKLPESARDWDEVVDLIDDAEDTESPAAIAMLRAELLAIRGRYDAARAVIEEARASQADRIEFWLAMAKIAERAGDAVREQTWKGQALLAGKHFDRAETHLREAVKLGRSSPEPFVLLLSCLHQAGKTEEAVKLHAEHYQHVRELKEPEIIAECYAATGKLELAEKFFKHAVKTKPKNSAVLRGLADLYLRNKQFEQAAPLLRRLSELGHISGADANWGRRHLAVVLASHGDYASFKQALNLTQIQSKLHGEAPEIAAATPAGKRIRAIVLAARPHPRNRREAIRLLEELADQQQLANNDRWLMGQLYERDGQWDNAIAQYETVLNTTNRRSARQLIQFMGVLLSRGKLEAAQAWMPALTKVEALTWRTRRMELWLQAFGPRSEKSVEALQDAVNEGHGHASVIERTFEVAGFARRIAGSMTDTAKATAFKRLAEDLMADLSISRPDAAFQVITMRAADNRQLEAMDACRAAWDRFDPETAAQISVAMLAGGEWSDENWNEIERLLEAATKKRSASIPLRIAMADLHSLRGRLDQAESLYRAILKGDSDNVIALNNLAWMQGVSGRNSNEGRQLIERAIEKAGLTHQLRDTRACILLAEGLAPEALGDMESVIDEAPTSHAYFHQALILGKLERWNEARDSFRQAQESGLNLKRLHPLERDAYGDLIDQLTARANP
ncbi:MAG: VanZ family protein [Planctomycetota bacterium]|nr:VanZ family protein [Planctomycetota bacterium]